LPDGVTPLTQFAAGLRALRVAAGQPPYRQLSAITHYSAATLARAASGQALPSLEVTLAYVVACDGDPVQWQATWETIAHATVPPPGAPVDDLLAIPRELPPGIRHFTGRTPELALLNSLLDLASPGTVLISAITGTAGVGKTALALHWAHRVASEFPDGQLYMNLRGFDPSCDPVAPDVAVRGFLDRLGVPPDRIPAGLESQAGLYRSMLAGKRVLVLLDNARDAAQVRPLLPGSARNLVVVTSRSRLTGLAVTESAIQVDLDVLTSAEAHELLRRHLGAARLAENARAVAEIVELCGRLPLALAIAAARTGRSGASLAFLAAELRDASERLDVLATGDSATDLRAVFSWSYERLGDDVQRMFRAIALHPGPDVSAQAAASLAGVPSDRASVMLGELTEAYLLKEQVPGRFILHDLLRAYAAEQARLRDSPADRRGVVWRMLDHYLHTGYAAALLLHPSRAPLDLAVAQPGASPEALSDRRQALDWFKTEHQVMLAVIAAAGAAGFDEHAWQIPWALATFLQRQGHSRDSADVQRLALAAAERVGDLTGLAYAHYLLALAIGAAGDSEDAYAHLSQALALWERLGDHPGQARTYYALARVSEEQGDYQTGLQHAQRAHDLYRGAGYRAGQARALGTVGRHHALQGNYRQALICCQQALALQRAYGDLASEADTLTSIGYAYHHLGRYAQAVERFQQALDLYRGQQHRRLEASSLVRLGDTQHDMGDLVGARVTWQQALDILNDLNLSGADELRVKLENTVAG
jgi:tetratricopeptide (TPR) repeat protein